MKVNIKSLCLINSQIDYSIGCNDAVFSDKKIKRKTILLDVK